MAEMPLNLAAHLLFKDSEKVTFLFLLDTCVCHPSSSVEILVNSLGNTISLIKI